MEIRTIASGSSGNCLLVSAGDSHLLVDAGISCRRITAALAGLGLSPEALSGILITHEHTDHISGLATLTKKFHLPVYTATGTARQLACRIPAIEDDLRPVSPGACFDLGPFTVETFPTSHDAPGSCGYRFDTEDGGAGLLTDTGFVTDEAADILPGVDLIVLEANHDVECLRSGPYPYYLKQRILGAEGHLCNEDAARFAVTLAEAGASELILAHLSKENNTPAMARNAVETALSAAGFAPMLSVAPRDSLGQAHIVSRRAVCKR